MKILVFGIDGLGVESFEKLKLKRLTKRLKNSKKFRPSIDNVVSRGWPEIFTGKHANETGAFYQVPQKNNSRIEISQSTGLTCVKKHIGTSSILWDYAQRAGNRVGVYCVPTTSSPEKIDGFFVSATGAGKFGNGISPNDVYPGEMLDGINITNMDLGFRLGYGALIPKDIDDFEKRGFRHIDDYFFLLRKNVERYPVDFLFAATRFVNEIAYKFIRIVSDTPSSKYSKVLAGRIFRLTDYFDYQLDCFINDMNVKHLFVVSDHGIGPFYKHVNLNELLYQNGYIKRKKATFKQKLIPSYHFLKRLQSGIKYGPIFPRYNLERAHFFSVGFTDLIYLNDERFDGKECNVDEAYEQSHETTSTLNNYCLENGLDKYMRFKALHLDKYANQKNMDGRAFIPLPNIRCWMEDGVTNTQRTNHLVLKDNVCVFEKDFFEKGFFGEYSGCKTTDTVMFYQGGFPVSKVNKLTDVYDSIVKVIDNEKNTN